MQRKTQKFYIADGILIGWILWIGLAEAAHLAAVFFGRSFSDAVVLFATAAAVSVLAVPGIVLYRRRRLRRDAEARREVRRRRLQRQMNYRPCTVFEAVLLLVFVLLVLYQLMTATASDAVYRTGDLTAETVESFLETDAVYQVNPLTGRPYEQGVPLRLKILCLPTFYGIICRVFGLTAAEVVWGIAPAAVLLGSYLAFYTLAGCFFPEEEEREKRWLFMLFAAALFCLGDYLYGMDGFGLLYSGFRGVAIRNGILVPYTFSLMLRRKEALAALCVLAEACIVWTLYGMGVCLLVVVLMTVVRRAGERFDRAKALAGKEA